MIKRIVCILSLSMSLVLVGEVNGFFMGVGY